MTVSHAPVNAGRPAGVSPVMSDRWERLRTGLAVAAFALLTVLFRYASGSDAAPTPADAASFVFAVRGTCAVCIGLGLVALVASVMRGATARRAV